MRADRRDKLLKWLDTGGQNCTPNNTLPAFLRRERFLDMTAGIVAWPSAEDLPPFRALEQAVLDTALARN